MLFNVYILRCIRYLIQRIYQPGSKQRQPIANSSAELYANAAIRSQIVAVRFSVTK